MSHNNHILRVDADSHSDARALVENAISDWGGENNYWHIIGSMCEDNTCLDEAGDETVNGEEMLKDYSRGFHSIIKDDGPAYEVEKLGALFISIGVKLIQGEGTYDIAKAIDSEKELALQNYRIKEFAGELYARAHITVGDTFDIWKQDFRSWQLDEFGITDVYGEEGEETKIYLVVIDMHS